jgi:hypothetical protein
MNTYLQYGTGHTPSISGITSRIQGLSSHYTSNKKLKVEEKEKKTFLPSRNTHSKALSQRETPSAILSYILHFPFLINKQTKKH